MKDKIKLLIQLQACDNRMKEIDKRKCEGPLRIQKLETELNDFMSKFLEQNERLELLRKDRREIEQEIKEFESNIEKSNIKLSAIKSNKEYKAVLKEIEGLKKGKSSIEDRAIQIMEEIEEMDKKYLETKDLEPDMKKSFKGNKKKIDHEIKELDGVLENLQKKRSSFTQDVDQDLLKKYLFLKERKDGQAISSVIGGVCQTCHMGIPPQKFNELIRGNSLLTCPHCNRIIYWGEEEFFQEASTISDKS